MFKPRDTLKPRANGRNIVGQILPPMLDVTHCVRSHTLFVACCLKLLQSLKPRQTFSYRFHVVLWCEMRCKFYYVESETQISSERDDRRIFLGLKSSIPGFFVVGRFGKYSFGWLDLRRDFFGYSE